MMNITNYDSFSAIADPHRREILRMLTHKDLSINAIADKFEISRPAVSKHVKVLNATGFISIETKGRERYCALNQKGFNEVQEWITYFEKYWMLKLKNLDTYLKTLNLPKTDNK